MSEPQETTEAFPTGVVTEIDEIPLDDWYDPTWDGDDSLLQPREGAGLTFAPVLATPRDALRQLKQRPLVVLFVREIKRGTSGWDVVAVKRALWHAGVLKKTGKFTPVMGPVAILALKKFQRRHGLSADGVYGRATHKQLAPFFDAFGAHLLHKVHVVRPASTAQKRLLMRSAALLTWNHAWEIHYTQSTLRMEGVRWRLFPPRFGRHEDCSSIATWLAFVAKAADPNASGYNGLGYTGTIAAHCAYVTVPKVGSFALYGSRWPYVHVTTCIGFRNGEPLVHSHGSERGPVVTTAHYRGDLHHWVDPFGGK